MAGRSFVMRPFLFRRPLLFRRHVIFAFVLCALAVAPVARADAACGSVKSETPLKSEIVEISTIMPDGTLTLADGRALRLATLEPPVDVDALAQWTKIISDEARGPASLLLNTKSQDRYGRLQGLVRLKSGKLLDAQLVSAGWARVSPRVDMRNCVSELLALEDDARVNKRGLWRLPEFAPLEANNLDVLNAREGAFVLVEGVVHDAVNRGGRLYVNFGDDWKTDFTVTVAPADARLFADTRFKAKSGAKLKIIGERVRVRGFLTRYNGPEMILTCPEQLEFLGQAVAKE